MFQHATLDSAWSEFEGVGTLGVGTRTERGQGSLELLIEHTRHLLHVRFCVLVVRPVAALRETFQRIQRLLYSRCGHFGEPVTLLFHGSTDEYGRKYMHTYVTNKSRYWNQRTVNIYDRTYWTMFVGLIALNLYHKVAFGSSTRTPVRRPGQDARGDQ